MCFCGLGFGAKAYGACAGNTAEEVAIGSLLGDSLIDLIVAAAADPTTILEILGSNRPCTST